MLDIVVRPDDGKDVPVKVTTRDVLQWEKVTQGKTLLDVVNENVTLGDFYTLAYFACTRTGVFKGKQKDFEAAYDIDIDSIVGAQVDDEPDPTPPEA